MQNQNTVEFVGYYGSDKQIALAAWTSTSRELTEEKESRIGKMVTDLWKQGHKTPFERGIVHFLVTTDIASHIHIIKHRLAGVNGESARYKELKEDKYYLPEDWKGIKSTDSTSFGNEWIDVRDMEWLQILENYTKMGNDLYHACLKDLTPVLGRKRAKESARYFKTYNSQITADVIMNMSCFANFLKLRNSDKAQLEIQQIAQQMLQLTKEIEGNPFEHTLNAFELK